MARRPDDRLGRRRDPLPTVLRNLGPTNGVPRFASPAGLGNPQYWVTGATADVDRDGRVDVFLTDFDPSRPSLLFRDESVAGHWLDVTMPGPGRGVGSLVEVYSPGQLGVPTALLSVREITTSIGYASGVPPIAHFGVGSNATVDVRVRMLRGGGVVDLRGVPADQVVHVP